MANFRNKPNKKCLARPQVVPGEVLPGYCENFLHRKDGQAVQQARDGICIPGSAQRACGTWGHGLVVNSVLIQVKG